MRVLWTNSLSTQSVTNAPAVPDAVTSRAALAGSGGPAQAPSALGSV